MNPNIYIYVLFCWDFLVSCYRLSMVAVVSLVIWRHIEYVCGLGITTMFTQLIVVLENALRQMKSRIVRATQIKIEHNYVIWVAVWEECRHQKYLIWICGKVATIRKESYILAIQNSLSEILFIFQAEKNKQILFLFLVSYPLNCWSEQ